MNVFIPALALPLALGLAASSLLAGPSVGGRFSLAGGLASGGGSYVVAGTPEPTTPTPLAGGGFEVVGNLADVVVVNGAVPMSIRLTDDGRIRIDWPSGEANLVLEESPDLDEPASWQPIAPAPTGNVYIAPANPSVRFYRLRRPTPPGL